MLPFRKHTWLVATLRFTLLFSVLIALASSCQDLPVLLA